MRVVCVADTHELHRDVVVPYGDLLIHAGDFTFFSKRRSIVRDFDAWLGELPHRHKIVVPGNHEYVLEDVRNRNLITNAILLLDSGVEIEGSRVWGSPGTPLYGGAFGMSDHLDRQRRWSQIPPDTDILITHGPPFGILDGSPTSEVHEGDPELLTVFDRVHPVLHVCGHIHGGYGVQKRGDTYHVNAALFDEVLGGIEREPIVVDLERLERAQ